MDLFPNEVLRMFLEHLSHRQRMSIFRINSTFAYLIETFPKRNNVRFKLKSAEESYMYKHGNRVESKSELYVKIRSQIIPILSVYTHYTTHGGYVCGYNYQSMAIEIKEFDSFDFEPGENLVNEVKESLVQISKCFSYIDGMTIFEMENRNIFIQIYDDPHIIGYLHTVMCKEVSTNYVCAACNIL